VRRTHYGVPVRDVDVPLMEARHAATHEWAELSSRADKLAAELRTVRRAERAAWKRCRAAGDAFEATISGKLYREALYRSSAVTQQSLRDQAAGPALAWHPLVVEWIFRQAARELFAGLFIRYARMVREEPWATITATWESRILRALASVSGTGWRYEWDVRTGRWAIYEPVMGDDAEYEDEDYIPQEVAV
jgi:hypothetical protein